MEPQNNLEIDGRLQANSCVGLLAEIFQAKLTGSLRLSNKKQKVIVYFDEGEVLFAVSNSREHRLFEILLEKNEITKKQLIEIEGFAKDLKLVKSLVDNLDFTKEKIDGLVSSQINKILRSIFVWKKGEWVFSPLARLKDGIRFDADIFSLLSEYGKSLTDSEVKTCFKSMNETFAINISDDSSYSINPDRDQAFVLSRIGEDSRTITEIVALSGLERNVLFKQLYSLWLSGMLTRENWGSQLKEVDISKINKTKIFLKTSATSFDLVHALEKERKEREEAKKAKDTKVKEKKEAKSKTVSINGYLKRIKDATTHYEIFGVSPESSILEIKKVYFSYAKRFHPDLFHKDVSEVLLKQVQNAFTEITRAYETIKDPKAREVYDFKLRKILEIHKANSDGKSTAKDSFEDHKNAEKALDQFETGYNLLLREHYSDALPYLARSVGFDDTVARYHAFYGKALSFDKQKRHQADGEIQAAIKIDPDNSLYRIMLSELYIKIGLAARAKGEITRLLKTDPDNQLARSLLDSLSQK